MASKKGAKLKKIRNAEGFTEWGDSVLSTPTSPVVLSRLKTPAFKSLVRKMFKMIEGIGVGLAANQIGLSDRFAIVMVEPNPKRPNLVSFPRTVIVNPRILRYSDEKQRGWEGCLSCGTARFYIERAKWIDVEYIDGATGEKAEKRVEGFPAIVFQHEIDHLDGKVCGEQVMVRDGKVVPGAIVTSNWCVKNKYAPPHSLRSE